MFLNLQNFIFKLLQLISMQIPDYQFIILTLPKLPNNGTEHTSPEVVEIIDNIFKLTEEEKTKCYQSGIQTISEKSVGKNLRRIRTTDTCDSWRSAKYKLKSTQQSN